MSKLVKIILVPVATARTAHPRCCAFDVRKRRRFMACGRPSAGSSESDASYVGSDGEVNGILETLRSVRP